MKELIRKLTQVSAPSGREKKVHTVILEELKGFIDGYHYDNVGNLIVWKNGNGENKKKIIFDGHADEIGLVITHIDDNGFLRVDPVGGVNPLMLLGTLVTFDGVTGIVSFEGETEEEAKKSFTQPSFDRIFVDIGVVNKEEAKKKVHIGQFGTYISSFVDLDPMLVSKSMDDRIACAIVIQVLKSTLTPYHDIYGVFSIQEEVGILGAKVAAYDLHADMAIAVDVTAHTDTPKAYKRMDLQLGKGPAIKIKDKASISDETVVNTLVECAKANEIPYQFEVLIFGGTNAHGYQLTGAGIKSGTLSIPCRYVHSPHEMVHYQDVLDAVRLLQAVSQKSDL
jgi:endoglucanase